MLRGMADTQVSTFSKTKLNSRVYQISFEEIDQLDVHSLVKEYKKLKLEFMKQGQGDEKTAMQRMEVERRFEIERERLKDQATERAVQIVAQECDFGKQADEKLAAEQSRCDILEKQLVLVRNEAEKERTLKSIQEDEFRKLKDEAEEFQEILAAEKGRRDALDKQLSLVRNQSMQKDQVLAAREDEAYAKLAAEQDRCALLEKQLELARKHSKEKDEVLAAQEIRYRAQEKLEEELERRTRELEKERGDLDAANNKIDEQANSIQLLERVIVVSKQELADMKNELTGTKKDCERSTEDFVEDQKEKQRLLQEEIDQWKTRAVLAEEKLEKRLQEYAEHHESLKVEQEALETKHVDYVEQQKQLTRLLQEESHQSRKLVETCERKFQRKLQEAENSLQDLEKERDALLEEVEGLKGLLDDAKQRAVESSQQQVVSVSYESARARSKQKSNEIHDLTQKLDKEKERAAELMREIEKSAEASVESQKDRNASLEQANASLEQRSSELELKVESLKQQLDDSMSQKDRNASLEQANASLEQQSSELELKVDSLTQQLDDSVYSIKKLQHERDQYGAETAQYRDELRKRLETSEDARLAAEDARLAAEKAQKSTDLQRQALEKLVEELKTEIVGLNLKLAKPHSIVEFSGSEQLQAEVAALQKQLQGALSDYQALRAKRTDNYEELWQKYQNLEAQRQMQTADEETKREELRKSLEETNAKLVNLQEQYRRLLLSKGEPEGKHVQERELAEVNASLERMKEARNKAEAEMVALQTQFQSELERRIQADKTIKELCQKIVDLEQELKQAKMRISDFEAKTQTKKVYEEHFTPPALWWLREESAEDEIARTASPRMSPKETTVVNA